MMIILNAEQASAMRGPTATGAALEPVKLADGTTWVLPAEVLADPAHESRHAVLAGLPQRAVAPEEWPAED